MRFALLLFLFSLLASPARAEFGLHLGSHFEFGSMGTSSADVYESRSMGAFGLQAMPGYRFLGKTLMAGLMFDLSFHSQLSGAGTSVDFSGTSLRIGPALAIELAMLKFLVGLDMRARHSTKASASYSGSGLRFLIGYRVIGNVWASIQLLFTKYKSRSVNGLEEDLSAQPVSSNMVGLGLSLSF